MLENHSFLSFLKQS